ncbi:MAG TPA: hydroxymethylglutaryl-CoA lyase [Acidimicrobiales bacterium]|nr:hydroxymethylglutaryl-CoA lyase [Acidimicrobiales bacterium]
MIALRDVTLRDGLQDEKPIATEDKLAIYEALVRAGVRDLELNSYVRPDRVPAMADAPELAAATKDDTDVARWALVLNTRGVQRAVESGMTNLQFVVSVSETHSQHNAGRTPDEALVEIERMAADLPDGVRFEVTLSTAFGCPYEGPIPPAAVLRAAERAYAAGAQAISLADTIGTGVPTEVAALTRDAVALGGGAVGVHLHDTRGLGIANVLAAIEQGASRADGTVGGLGGCPFAPGASGNLALEDLVHVLEESGVDTGIDLEALVDVARLATDLVGRPVESHVGKAGRRFGTMA